MSQNQINTYLKENKDKYSKKALVAELLKAGHREGDVKREVESVYGEEKKQNLQMVDLKKSESVAISKKKINGKVVYISLVLLFIILFFLQYFSFVAGLYLDDFFVTIFFIICLPIFIWVSGFIVEKLEIKLLVKSKTKYLIMFVVVLVFCNIFLYYTIKATGKIMPYVDNIITKAGIGDPEKIECIKSGGKWGDLGGFSRTAGCRYKCPPNTDEYGYCIDRKKAPCLGFEYGRGFDGPMTCFIN